MGFASEAEYPKWDVPEGLRRKMVEVARQFRKAPTPSEAILWQALRGKQLEGIKFRRQQPIGPFVVDFFAPSLRLVVEVDGTIHATQVEADRQRQQLLESLGLRVIRLTSLQVETDLPAALQTIRTALAAPTAPAAPATPAAPAAPPSPLAGEGGGGVEGRQMPLFKTEWKGAEGLAEDVRYYGKWMRDEAEKRIGHLYPKYKITQGLLAERPDLKAHGLKPGNELTVIAWLWARTVKCPNPACGAQMPLMKSFWLGKRGNTQSWVEPIVDNISRRVKFEVKVGHPTKTHYNIDTGTSFLNDKKKTVKATACCLLCGSVVKGEYIDSEANNHNIQLTAVAIVAESLKGRVYLPFEHEFAQDLLIRASIERVNSDFAFPDEPCIGTGGSNAQGRSYGFTVFSDYFTDRQLVLLATFSETLDILNEQVENRDTSYIDAIRTYLAFALDKGTNLWSSLVSWMNDRGAFRETFARQAIPFIWDFAEANPFSSTGGGLEIMVERIADTLEFLPSSAFGRSDQFDASKVGFDISNIIISTDPPYYGNIGYAHLSDYFYVWLRRFIGKNYSTLFATLLTPKNEELVVTPYKFDGDETRADKYFQTGMGGVFDRMKKLVNNSYPITVFYALKQQENVGENFDHIATGWEKMLQAMIDSGLIIDGTWPINTESEGRAVAIGSNALASSIVLVCRPLHENTPTISRRDFLASLKHELPPALRKLQQGSIAPVDLAQAAIGPGMAVFSRYKQVLEADGSPMRVRTALALINQALDEFLAEQEGEYDADTRWALAWYEQYGFNEGPFGVAETLSKAKNTSVAGLGEAGILLARAGKVRLLKRDELLHAPPGGRGAGLPPSSPGGRSDGLPPSPLGGRGAGLPPSHPGDRSGGLHPSHPGGRGAGGEGFWDPSQDKRPTAWEAVQHLIRALDTHGEQGAALLLSRLGGLGEVARDLAYRLYTICERKGWAQDALGYNMLVVAWPRIKELSGKVPRQDSLL